MAIRIKTKTIEVGFYGLRTRSTCDHCKKRRMTTGVAVDLQLWYPYTHHDDVREVYSVPVGRLCDECVGEVL